MIRILGAPFDLCGGAYGSRLGPTALRLAGLLEALQDCVDSVEDGGDLWPLDSSQPKFDERVQRGVESIRVLKDAVANSIGEGRKPVVLGGDHSLSIGSVAGAIESVPGPVGLLWVDAHMDLNTPATTPSGNLHGMSVAAIKRLPGNGEGVLQSAWDELMALMPEMAVFPAWLGLRDVDQGERENFRHCGDRFAATMKDVDRNGIAQTMSEIVSWYGKHGVRDLWLSFDVDVLDPVFAPGTGTAVRGGLTYREAHLVVETLFEATESRELNLLGVDLVETNPLRDRNNETAHIGIEILGSLFGRTVLSQEYRQ